MEARHSDPTESLAQSGMGRVEVVVVVGGKRAYRERARDYEEDCGDLRGGGVDGLQKDEVRVHFTRPKP